MSEGSHHRPERRTSHLAQAGEQGEVQRTPVGWVLLGIQDPDGHDVRFYTVPLELPPGGFPGARPATATVSAAP